MFVIKQYKPKGKRSKQFRLGFFFGRKLIRKLGTINCYKKQNYKIYHIDKLKLEESFLTKFDVKLSISKKLISYCMFSKNL